MRRAKIVCTLGPSSDSQEAIEALIDAGMNVARLNFSHGDHDFHRELVNRVRAAANKLGQPVAILQDLQGPKIRCQKMEGGVVQLEEGATTVITTEECLGTAERFGTSYSLLPRDVEIGQQILLDDGNLTLRVESKTETEVTCTVIDGGPLKDRKGINLPDSKVSAPSLTEKDIRDAHFGAEVGVDAVALSFVRTRHDVRTLRRELAQTKSRPLIIAKLEKPQAIDQLEQILEEADGVMVARGDLGVEMPPEKVPMIQKRIVDEANRRGKTVIVATQMLESMIHNPRPTRAEASDVANAVLDGADAVMLSGETAAGKNPRAVVEMMARIVVEVERGERARYMQTEDFLSTQSAHDFQNAISLAAVRTADALGAQAVAVYTATGNTARLVSDYRPRMPIVALAPSEEVQRRLAFAWGVEAKRIEQPRSVEQLAADLDEVFLKNGALSQGDRVVVCTKIPVNSRQRTNTLYLHTIGSARFQ